MKKLKLTQQLTYIGLTIVIALIIHFLNTSTTLFDSIDYALYDYKFLINRPTSISEAQQNSTYKKWNRGEAIQYIEESSDAYDEAELSDEELAALNELDESETVELTEAELAEIEAMDTAGESDAEEISDEALAALDELDESEAVELTEAELAEIEAQSQDMDAVTFEEVSEVNYKNPMLSDDIIIVMMDERSLSDQRLGKWPWDRRVHARMIHQLSQQNPEALFYDIFFTERSRPSDNVLQELGLDPAERIRYRNILAGQDYILVQETKKSGSVFYDYPANPVHYSNRFVDYANLYNDGRYNYFQRRSLPASLDTIKKIPHNEHYTAIIPISELTRYAAGLGHAVVREDSDGTMRKMPLLLTVNEQIYPSIVLRLAMNHYNVPPENVIIKLGRHIVLKDAVHTVREVTDHIELDGDTQVLVQITNTRFVTNDVVIPINNRGQMDINYAGSSSLWAPNQISYYDLLNNDYVYRDDPLNPKGGESSKTYDTWFRTVKGKIVMIGAFGAGIAHDVWDSPNGLMMGIVHHANALNTILTDNFLTRVPGIVNLLILISIAILISVFIPRTNIIINLILSIGLILGWLIIDWGFVFPPSALFPKQIILNSIGPFLMIIFGFLSILGYRLLIEDKEKQLIKNRFKNYVSGAVVDELLKNPKAAGLGGVNKNITVLFSDVRSFTTISEQLGDPQKLVALLNEYLGAMTDIIMEDDGTLDKYVGDEIMAFWGAPIKQEDHAVRACRSALKQIDYLYNVLHKKWDEEGKPKLYIGIGINTGTMTVGNMGSSRRMDYTLMGDNVNLGARLEGTNKVYKTWIIISEYTYTVVKDHVIVRELDNIRVKGKSQPVKIYELLAMKDDDSV